MFAEYYIKNTCDFSKIKWGNSPFGNKKNEKVFLHLSI
jgi:hypothetical protein